MASTRIAYDNFFIENESKNCMKTSILIVEDEAVIAMGIQADLEKLGYEVAGTAYRGAEAIEMTGVLKPDLVLMDIMLHSQMDGVDTAMIISQRFNLPVIFITAMTDGETIQRAKLCNPYGYVLKPIRTEELSATIEFGLYKHNLEKQVRRGEEKIRCQAHFAHQLSQSSTHLNAQLSLDGVFETICVELAQTLSADCLRIVLCDTQKDIFVPAYDYGKPWKADATCIETFLICEGRPIGAIYIAWISMAQTLSDEEKWFLSAFANQASIAIEHARLYEKSRRRAEELEFLYQLSRKLRQAHTRKEMLPILLDQAINISQADAGIIYLLDRGNQPGLCFRASTSDYPVYDWFQPNEPLWINVLADESHSYKEEAAELSEEDSKHQLPAKGHFTKIAFVLRTSQSAVGILALNFPYTMRLDDGTKQVMMALMEVAANALERSGTMEMLEQRVTDRTRELSALYDLAIIMSSQLDQEQILHDSLKRVMQPVGAQATALYLYNPKEAVLNLTAQVSLSNEMLTQASQLVLIDRFKTWLETSDSPWLDFKGQTGMPYGLTEGASFGTVVNVPVRYESQTLGLLSVLWEEIKDIAAEDIALLSAVAERLGSAIQNRTYRKQAEQAAVMKERHRLSQELHDSVTQSLYSQVLLSEAGRDLAASGNQPMLDKCLQDLQQSSHQALREMRLLLFELHVPEMKGKNLIQALQNRLEAVERRGGTSVKFQVVGSVFLSNDYQEELYQIASEALNNILKHARASHICIMIESSPEAFAIEIEDNGCGFDPQEVPVGGMGLESIQERIRRMDGTYVFHSELGKGTKIGVILGQKGSDSGHE